MGAAFKDGLAMLISNAVTEVESHAIEFSQPKIDGEDVIVTCSANVFEMALDYGKDGVLLLQSQQREPKRTEKLTSDLFENVEVAGIVNMIAHGAFGVGNAVLMAEDSVRHGATLRVMRRSRELELVAGE